MTAIDRAALRTALRAAAPWLDATEFGPRAVDAGTCERCEQAPRLLPTCGPDAPGAVCRSCAEALGDDGWCAGHLEDGRAARTWARGLPDRWADIVVLWWVGTGEVRPSPGAGPDTSMLSTALGPGDATAAVRRALSPER